MVVVGGRWLSVKQVLNLTARFTTKGLTGRGISDYLLPNFGMNRNREHHRVRFTMCPLLDQPFVGITGRDLAV